MAARLIVAPALARTSVAPRDRCIWDGGNLCKGVIGLAMLRWRSLPAQAAGLQHWPQEVLFSLRRFKQQGASYFRASTKEAEHAGA